MTRSPISAQAIVRLGADHAVAADPHLRADHRVGADQRARADLGAGTDHRARIDDDAGLEPRRRMDEGGGRDAGLAEARAWPERPGIQPRHRQRHGAIGLRRHQDGAARRRSASIARRDEGGAGAGRAKEVEILRIVEEGEIAGARPSSGATSRMRRSGSAPGPSVAPVHCAISSKAGATAGGKKLIFAKVLSIPPGALAVRSADRRRRGETVRGKAPIASPLTRLATTDRL